MGAVQGDDLHCVSSKCQLLAVAAPLRVEYDGSVSATVFKPFFTGTAHNTLPLEHLDVRIK